VGVLVLVLMAITVVAFDPLIHQKVRYREQLYAVFLQDIDLALVPPNFDVPIYFVSHEKILLRQENGRQFTVKKKELTLVEPHIIE
jgi:hypothetical protein